MGSAPASLADNPFLITLLLEMQTTIFLRTEMSRKTEYVHNPCFLSANILKILGVFAENQISFIGAIGWCTFFYLHIFDGYIDLELLFLFLPAITTMMYIIWTGFGNKKV